jgi:hypothetical protein
MIFNVLPEADDITNHGVIQPALVSHGFLVLSNSLHYTTLHLMDSETREILQNLLFLLRQLFDEMLEEYHKLCEIILRVNNDLQNLRLMIE